MQRIALSSSQAPSPRAAVPEEADDLFAKRCDESFELLRLLLGEDLDSPAAFAQQATDAGILEKVGLAIRRGESECDVRI